MSYPKTFVDTVFEADVVYRWSHRLKMFKPVLQEDVITELWACERLNVPVQMWYNLDEPNIVYLHPVR